MGVCISIIELINTQTRPAPTPNYMSESMLDENLDRPRPLPQRQPSIIIRRPHISDQKKHPGYNSY